MLQSPEVAWESASGGAGLVECLDGGVEVGGDWPLVFGGVERAVVGDELGDGISEYGEGESA